MRSLRRSREVEELVPYIPASQKLPEFTPFALILGAALSLCFGMVNAYLGLRAGLTVSASIPSAVISMAVMKGVFRRGTVLENNIVQTVASTGESVAAGVIFTVPAFLFLQVSPTGLQIFLLASTAALLGILLLIPLRHPVMVEEHGVLPFPEGTACAQVLIAGDRGGVAARPVFAGIAVGAFYQFCSRALGLWRESVLWSFEQLHKATIGFELSPIFLGIGYLVGLRIALVMLAGGAVGWGLLIPLFDSLAGSAAGAALGVGEQARRLDAAGLWSEYVRYAGAGAVAAGGLAAMARALPTVRVSLGRLFAAGQNGAKLRTELDLPQPVVFGGIVILALAMGLSPSLFLSWPAVVLAVFFTFFFVVVSARIVGLLGTTAQPVSGMTITALLATTAALGAIGQRGSEEGVGAMSVAAVVAIGIAVAGDLSQDLKTGALLGATPRKQQVAEMIGALVAALRAGWVLLLLHKAYTIGSSALPAPQAKLMATLVEGVTQGNLPLPLMALGAALALAVEITGLPSLAFAIGLYLPITTSAALIFGALLGRLLGGKTERGTLCASGLVAGDALMGVALAAAIVSGFAGKIALRTPGQGPLEAFLTILAFACLLAFLGRSAGRTPQALARR